MNTSEQMNSSEPQSPELESLKLQAQKIKELLEANERLGADLQEARERIGSLEHDKMELLTYKSLVHQRLGLDLAQAKKNLDILYARHQAFSSPGHRLVSFIGNRIGHGTFGKYIRRLMNFGLALRKA